MFDITHPATTTYIVSIYVCILSVHTSVYIHTFYVQGVGCHFCGGCCVCTMPEGPSDTHECTCVGMDTQCSHTCHYVRTLHL